MLCISIHMKIMKCISREYRKLTFVNNLKVKIILSDCNWDRKCE